MVMATRTAEPRRRVLPKGKTELKGFTGEINGRQPLHAIPGFTVMQHLKPGLLMHGVGLN